ncbi:MBL fold metallo-hydrolase [Arthrobacter sp. I2-34]|uniref:MBL fold metallo-hydrolase n=1 Tax=Arthrobacter hankyongi TaxID=2904801 RepID=A0ABS9L7A9_9MICC|nr:MBL fold metallo-hydrolase [Arthrobacter hankyongi]MCG2622555.1 MBL fold metallo-hydrolase [Arthrobacter hankyongi]
MGIGVPRGIHVLEPARRAMKRSTAEAPNFGSGPDPLAGGRIHRLGGDILLDERVSWCPPGVRRRQPVSCYLVRGRSGSVLVDTGIRLHADQILRQLDRLLAPGEPLSIVLTRTEMECCLNLPAIEARFSVESVWYTGGITVPRAAAAARRVSVEPGSSLEVEVIDGVVLEFVSPLLRLLPTLWIFDPESGVLLTSDAFTHGTDAGADPRDGLRKFRWFTQADTRPIAHDVLRNVRNRQVAAIGPGYGVPFTGVAECAREAEGLAVAIFEMGGR